MSSQRHELPGRDIYTVDDCVYNSTRSEHVIWSLLWDSIRNSKLTAGYPEYDTSDEFMTESPEFNFEDEQTNTQTEYSGLHSPNCGFTEAKIMSKTARERKAARERKMAKLTKYKKNTKLIRTRRNKSGTRDPWGSSLQNSGKVPTCHIFQSLDDGCSETNSSTHTADTRMLTAEGDTHHEPIFQSPQTSFFS